MEKVPTRRRVGQEETETSKPSGKRRRGRNKPGARKLSPSQMKEWAGLLGGGGGGGVLVSKEKKKTAPVPVEVTYRGDLMLRWGVNFGSQKMRDL